jgi:hypothetical protein
LHSLEFSLVVFFVSGKTATSESVRDSRNNTTPHFGFTFITRLTHDEVNDAGAADDPHVTFLRHFRDEGYVNNTVLIYYR